MDTPRDLRYTASHEWVRPEDGGLVVGITDFAQQQLSDITFVELPSVGDHVNAGDEAVVVESVKIASEVYAPVSGSIVQVNELLTDHPELINQQPYGEGWLFVLKADHPDDVDDLMTAEEYEARDSEGE